MLVWVNVWEEVSSNPPRGRFLTHIGQPDDDLGERLAERLALCERAHNMGLKVLAECESYSSVFWASADVSPKLIQHSFDNPIAEGWDEIKICLLVMDESRAIAAVTQPLNPTASTGGVLSI